MPRILSNLVWIGLFCAMAVALGFEALTASQQIPEHYRAESAKRRSERPSVLNESHPTEQEAKRREKQDRATEHAIEFFDIKVSDAIIAIFTIVLAMKTAGLFQETAGLKEATLRLHEAGERQLELMKEFNAAQSRKMQSSIAAANRSAAAAEDALIKLQRAFVLLRDLSTEVDKNSGGVIQAVKFTARWENSGSSPTKWFLMRINLAYFDPNKEPIFVDQGEWPSNHSVIGPRALANALSISTPNIDLRSVVDGTRNLFVWGWAEYDDIFVGTPRHRTEFCFQVLIQDDGTKTSITTRQHSQHNGADEECGQRYIDAQARRPRFAPVQEN